MKATSPDIQELRRLIRHGSRDNLTPSQAREKLGDQLPEYMRQEVPACMLWPLPDEQVMAEPLESNEWISPRIQAWQDGRCGICGRDKELVLDHCHTTGWIRGFLCSACNRHEAANDSPWFVRWRSGWNPAMLLGLYEDYISPITGRPSLSPFGEYLRMTPADRVAHDEAMKRTVAAISKGGRS